MRTNSGMLGLAMLALTACSGTGTVWLAPEDQPMPANQTRQVRGDVAEGDAALAGSGTLSGATTAQVVTLGEGGDTTVNGSAAVEADGTFVIDAAGMTRTFVVQLLDADGELVGGAIVTADASGDSGIDAGTVDAETSVEAAVWAQVVAQAGYDQVVSSEVRARVDAATSAAAQAWVDGHGASEAAFSAMAEAVIGASIARQDQVRAAGVAFGAHAQGELRGWLYGAGDAHDLAAALDGALEARGVAASDRSIVTARTEATFRAALAGALDDGDAGSDELFDASTAASGALEVWGHVDAWAALADDEDEHRALLLGVYGDLSAQTDGAGALAVSGDSLHAVVQASVTTLFQGVLDADLGVDLGAVLGGSNSGGAQADEAEAVADWSDALHGDLEASVQAAADAGAGAEEIASATGDAWADAAARVDVALESAGASEDVALRAALMLSAAAFVDAG